MHTKILYLIFLFQISFEQTRPQIKILNIHDPKCSDTLGKMEYKAQFTCSPYEEINSYFMLYYKDNVNKKHPTICKLFLPKSGQIINPSQNGTIISTQDIDTTTPEGEVQTSTQNSKDGETDIATSGDIDIDTGGNVVIGTIGNTDIETSGGTDIETSGGTDIETSGETDIETSGGTDIETSGNTTEIPQPTNDDLELYLTLLRENIEDSLGNASITGSKLYNLSLDLKVIYDYKVRNQFKTLLDRINKMEIKLNEFNAKNIYVPLDNSINILLQKIKDFDYKKIYDRINETVCFNKQLILKDINKKKALLEFGQKTLKSPIDALKDKVEEQFNSSLLNDLISKFANKTINLPEIPDFKDSELGQKILDFNEKINDLRKNGSSELLQKIDGFQNTVYQSFVNLIDEKISKTTNFVINHLLIVQGQMNEIKQLRNEYKDKNATANEIIQKTRESMINNFKKIKDNLLDFLENNAFIKPIIEQIKTAEEKIKEAVNESELIKIIQEFINNNDNEAKNQLQESLYKIKDLLKDASKGSLKEQIANLPNLTSAIFEEFKNILEIDELLKQLKEKFNGTSLEDLKDNEDVKEIIDNLKEKANQFLDNTFLLKIIVNNADKLNDDLKNELKNAGIEEAVQKYLDTLKSLPETLKELNIENNDKINKTLYDVIDKIKEALEKNGVLEKLPKSTEDLKEIISKIQQLPESIKLKINEDINKTEEAIKSIKEFNNKLKDDLDEKLEEAGVKDAFNQFIKNAKDLQKIINETRLNDKKYLEELYYKLGDKISASLEKGKEILEELKDVKTKDDLVNKVNELTNLNLIMDEIKNIFDLPKRKENIKNIFADLKQNLDKLNDEQKKKLEDKLDELGLKEPLETYIQGLKDLAKVVKENGEIDMELLKEQFYNDQEKLKELLQKAKELGNKLKDLQPDQIKDYLKNLTNIEPIMSEVQDMFNVTKYFDSSKIALVNALEDLKTKLKELEAKINTPENKKLIEELKNLTEALNLKESFSKNIEQLEDLKKAIEPIKDKLKDQFDIESLINKLQDFTHNLNSTTLKESIKNLDPLLTMLEILNLHEIYDNLNKTLTNLKNADLSFLEPLKNYIMSLNGTDMKEKQKEIINLINAINADVKNVLNNNNIPSDLTEKLENLKISLSNLNINDWEEKINSIIEKIKALEPDSLKKLTLEKIQELKEKSKGNDFLQNLKNIKQLVQDSKLAELLGTEQEKIKAALNATSPNILELIEQLKTEIKDDEVVIELKDHLSDLQNLLKALKNLKDKVKLNETLYEIAEKIEDFDIQKLQEEVAAKNKELYEKLKELSDVDESLEEIKKLLKESKLGEMTVQQQQKLIEKLNELKEKIDKTNIIEELKAQIEKNEIINGVKVHLNDIKNLFDALKNLGEGGLKELNGTIYQLKEQIDNKEILELIAKLPMGDKIVEQINKIKPQLEKLKDLANKEITMEDIQAKLDEIKGKIKNTKIPESLKVHFEAIKKAIKSYQELSSENRNKIKDALYNIKDKVENINGTKMILLLNSSIFNSKNEIIEKIRNSTELEQLKDKILDNLNPFKQVEGNINGGLYEFKAQIDKLKQTIKEKYTGPMKDKILDAINNLKKQIDALPKAITDRIKDLDIYKKYEELTKLSEELKANLKNFTDNENLSKLNDAIEQLKDHLSPNNVKLVVDKITDSVFSCDTKLNTLIGIKKDIEEMKKKYENSDAIKIIDNSKGEIKMFVKKLKEKVIILLDDSKFEPFSSDLKELNASLQESWKKIQEDEYVQEMKVRIDKTKEILKKIKEQTELVTLNETIYHKNNIIIVSNFIYKK